MKRNSSIKNYQLPTGSPRRQQNKEANNNKHADLHSMIEQLDLEIEKKLTKTAEYKQTAGQA